MTPVNPHPALLSHVARWGPIAATAFVLSACVSTDRAPRSGDVGGMLRSGTGTVMGNVALRETAAGLEVSIAASSLAPGVYGAHIHAVGRCELPTFQSAGGHWNPGAREHGRLNPMGTHAGDLGNVVIGPRGSGTHRIVVPGTFNGAGEGHAAAGGLLDADGAAIVLHARRDDERTDPSGNSGDRIACAVISRF